MKHLVGKIPTVVYEDGSFIVKWIKEKTNEKVQKVLKKKREVSKRVRTPN